MTGLDKALVQPPAVVTGAVPTRLCPRFAQGAVPVKGSSVWSEPLSPERSPFMAIWEPAMRGCPLLSAASREGRRKGYRSKGSEGMGATGLHADHSGRTKEVEAVWCRAVG